MLNQVFYNDGVYRVAEINSIQLLTWLGIVFCLSQSAMFSGLNLAMFGVSRLRLEIEVAAGGKNAEKILQMRHDTNFLLTTILWGNVAINVLLTLLSDSVMAGASAFIFSTVAITFFGEITPQAYFSRNALRMGALLAPVLKIYQVILFPVAKPSALILDWWLGKEGIQYFQEHNLRELIKKHIDSDETNIDLVEGIGALNFLDMDDILASKEGEPIDPRSIIVLPIVSGKVDFPKYQALATDNFLKQITASGKKWIIITDSHHEPQLVLNSNSFLRAVFMNNKNSVDPRPFCHKPIIVRDSKTLLGKVITQLKVSPKQKGDDVVDNDLILLWDNDKRIITGADILGRLLRGITYTSK